MEFVKVHGTGNDFVLLADFEGRLELDGSLVRALCDRHLGVGGDGVLRLAPPGDGSDVFMDYRNADGSVSEMCGNGVRCVAKYLVDRGLVSGDVVRVGTRAGMRAVEVVQRDAAGRLLSARVDMGAPRLTGDVTVELPHPAAEPTKVQLTTVSMGNPHALLPVPDVAAAPVAAWGPAIEHDAAFPHGTNVGFVQVVTRARVRGRIWERGVGETQASGTVASAIAVAAHVWGATGRRTAVALPGGELEVEWTEETLYVTGPAVEVAGGRLDEDWLARAQEGP